MEEDITGEPVLPRPSSSSAAIAAAQASAVSGPRQRFSVELRPGETTIVSWKKLTRDTSKENAPSSSAPVPVPSRAHPALESRFAPATSTDQHAEGENPQSTGRFNAVIERIERLYMGKESSDEEELNDVPDDDEYDTEDSFIDDTELNDYFQVDNSATKHNGFFINRGKLERIEPSSVSDTEPRKRRRRESVKPLIDKNEGHVPIELVNMSTVKMKAAARNAPLVGKRSSDQSNPSVYDERYQERITLKNKSIMSAVIDKKKPNSAINLEMDPSLKLSKRDTVHLMDTKDSEKQKTGFIQSKDLLNKSGSIGEASDAMQDAFRDKNNLFQVDSQSRKPGKDEYDLEKSKKSRHGEKNGNVQLLDLNSPGSLYTMQTVGPSARVKDGSGGRLPKGTALERAIRDLEKTVAESRPIKSDVQEGDSTPGVKKRLPSEIKQKLAKVARLADSQGKIASEQFLLRLMGILGHLVQTKTLKRHLKEMVEIGLTAKQAKARKFQEIKKEVTEMIKMKVAASKSKTPDQVAGSSDDFQEPLGRALKAVCGMDDAIEDKICDLYDLYVEGMDEDKGPQLRKLYAELAELWPAGCMDNLGIKDSVKRAKDRKRALYKQYKLQDEERIKRRKLSSAPKTEQMLKVSGQVRVGQDRSALDSAGQALVSSQRAVSNQVFISSGRNLT